MTETEIYLTLKEVRAKLCQVQTAIINNKTVSPNKVRLDIAILNINLVGSDICFN